MPCIGGTGTFAERHVSCLRGGARAHDRTGLAPGPGRDDPGFSVLTLNRRSGPGRDIEVSAAAAGPGNRLNQGEPIHVADTCPYGGRARSTRGGHSGLRHRCGCSHPRGAAEAISGGVIQLGSADEDPCGDQETRGGASPSSSPSPSRTGCHAGRTTSTDANHQPHVT